MLSSEDLKKIKELLGEMGLGNNASTQEQSKKHSGKNAKSPPNGTEGNNPASCFELHPSSLLVIAGLITGVLNVESVLVNRNQVVQIVIAGELKRKTQLEKVMECIGKLPFEDIIKAIIENNV